MKYGVNLATDLSKRVCIHSAAPVLMKSGPIHIVSLEISNYFLHTVSVEFIIHYQQFWKDNIDMNN